MTPNYSISPYLHFEGRCEEAIEFYKQAVGAQPQMMLRFGEAPPEAKAQCAGIPDDKIMHARISVGNDTILLSDGRCSGHSKFEGFSLSLTVQSAAEAEKLFTALSEGGKIQLPLTKTFFSPAFGMTADKFGVPWMVYVDPSKA